VDISKFIYDYLMEYNIPVVVPELGCFTIVNIPSEIRDGKVIPPSKTVKLDSENSGDDGVLTSYIARKANITFEQAADEIRKFYHQNFISRLPLIKKLFFEKFGTFSLDEVNNIVFCPDEEFFKDNYGLGYAYFSGNVYQQPVEAPVEPTPEPVFIQEPVFTLEPEPIFTPAQEPVISPDPEPVIEPLPEPDQSPHEQPQPLPEDSLFDTNDSSRFRENTSRKRTQMFDEKELAVKPASKAKTSPAPKKQKQKTSANSSNMWVLWVLLAAAGLGLAGYYFYPKIYLKFFTPKTTITSLVELQSETIPLVADEMEESTSNAELSQTLDDATDKKVALKPEGTQPTESPASKSPSTPATTTRPATETKPAQPAQMQTTAGQGRYVLIVASFRARSEAERFGRRLPEGLSFEIIPAMVNGAQWNRVSVGSYNTLEEATRQAGQIRSKPNCQDVWVAKR